MVGDTIRKAVLLICCISLACTVQGQDACTQPPSKKAQKLIDEAANSPKLSDSGRLDLINEALNADPGCVACLFAKARLQYQIAYERNGNTEPAWRTFGEVIEACPQYHADAFYYRGIISYSIQEYEASAEALEAFLLFDTTKGKSSRDHQVKRQDAEKLLPEVKFYSEFYANPVPFNPVRVGGINSAGDEYLPMLSPDNEYIYFTRKSTEKAKGDIYFREVELLMQSFRKTGLTDFESPSALPPPFNVGDNYGGVSISLDNRELFVTVCKPVSSTYKNCDIYVTRYQRSIGKDGRPVFTWSGLENLGDKVNTSDGWEAQPSISADGSMLFFATIRSNTTPDESGNPTIDIYFTERQKDGIWSEAKSLGNDINTRGNDKSPFLHTDSRTLYFSSNGRPGAGGYDIYYCRQDEKGTWSKPKNIGYPINSPQDEHGLIVSTDGTKAYFASANKDKSQGLDIFSFEVPQKARPEKIMILKGEVATTDGSPPADARMEVKYAKSQEIKEFEVDKDDGSYAAVLNLKADEEVLVSLKSDTETLAFNSRVFTLADTVTAVQEIAMTAEPVKLGMAYRMNDIRYGTNSSDLDEASKRVLDEFVIYLLENSMLKIEIGGHTDSVGDPKKNLVLSTDRAFEVFGYLQTAGINHNRMTFKGYGDSVPVAPNTSELNRAKNRRTEFKIISTR
jgi:outer membrane protein OmpA-like peptidoglycan-associated protein